MLAIESVSQRTTTVLEVSLSDRRILRFVFWARCANGATRYITVTSLLCPACTSSVQFRALPSGSPKCGGGRRSSRAAPESRRRCYGFGSTFLWHDLQAHASGFLQPRQPWGKRGTAAPMSMSRAFLKDAEPTSSNTSREHCANCIWPHQPFAVCKWNRGDSPRPGFPATHQKWMDRARS